MKKELVILSTKILNPEAVAFASRKNIRIIASDFIKIFFLNIPPIQPESQTIDGPIIFTSKNGVAGFKLMFDDSANAFLSRQVYCLSGETKKAVDSIPWLNIVGTAPDARALGDIIINRHRSESFNYFCSKSRRPELPDLLKTAGIRVKEFHVYKTELNPQRITSAFDAVLFFSPSAVDSFFQSNILAGDTPCFCVGETTAAAVNFHGAKAIAAERPDQFAVLERAIKYFRSSEKNNTEHGRDN